MNNIIFFFVWLKFMSIYLFIKILVKENYREDILNVIFWYFKMFKIFKGSLIFVFNKVCYIIIVVINYFIK